MDTLKLPTLTAPRRRIAIAVAVVLVAGAVVAVVAPPTKGVSGRRTEPVVVTLAPDERALMFAGDIMLSRNVAESLAANGRPYSYPFDAVRDVLTAGDAAFANLESPVSGRGEKLKKKFTFNASPQAIEGLRTSGLDIVSLANNHTLDYGMDALADTEKYVVDAGLKIIGVTNEGALQEPVVLDVRGLKVGYLAYCDPQSASGCAKQFNVFPRGPARAEDGVLERDIAALRPRVDILVVSMHWGTEYRLEPNARQQQLGRHVIDLGADILAGHHPHVQQEPEMYKKGVILYSMGNFIFDQQKISTRESRIYRIIATKDGIKSVAFWPLEIADRDWQPRPKDDEFVVVAKWKR